MAMHGSVQDFTVDLPQHPTPGAIAVWCGTEVTRVCHTKAVGRPYGRYTGTNLDR